MTRFVIKAKCKSCGKEIVAESYPERDEMLKGWGFHHSFDEGVTYSMQVIECPHCGFEAEYKRWPKLDIYEFWAEEVVDVEGDEEGGEEQTETV